MTAGCARTERQCAQGEDDIDGREGRGTCRRENQRLDLGIAPEAAREQGATNGDREGADGAHQPIIGLRPGDELERCIADQGPDAGSDVVEPLASDHEA